jgi:hypothetical protein
MHHVIAHNPAEMVIAAEAEDPIDPARAGDVVGFVEAQDKPAIAFVLSDCRHIRPPLSRRAGRDGGADGARSERFTASGVSSCGADRGARSRCVAGQDSINGSVPRLCHGASRMRPTREVRLAASGFAGGLHRFSWARHQEQSLRERLQAAFVPDPRLPPDMEALVCSLAARLAELRPDPAPAKPKRSS